MTLEAFALATCRKSAASIEQGKRRILSSLSQDQVDASRSNNNRVNFIIFKEPSSNIIIQMNRPTEDLSRASESIDFRDKISLMREKISRSLTELNRAKQFSAENRRKLDNHQKESLSLQCELASARKVNCELRNERDIEAENIEQINQRRLEVAKELIQMEDEEKKLSHKQNESYKKVTVSIEDKKEGKTMQVSSTQLSRDVSVELKKKIAQLKRLLSTIKAKAAEYERNEEEEERQQQLEKMIATFERKEDEKYYENQF